MQIIVMETNFNFNSQVCTDRNQSERLLVLGLKPETADCHWEDEAYFQDCKDWNIYVGYPKHLPAWSMHRLMLLIPKEVNIDGYRFPLRSDALMRLDEADDMYEYLIGVLERTIKEGYFNKDYLEE